MKRIIASIGIISTLMLSACGNSATPAAPAKEVPSGTYYFIGMTEADSAVSNSQLSSLNFHVELTFNEDMTGTLSSNKGDTEKIPFTYDADGNLLNPISVSQESTPVPDGAGATEGTITRYVIIDNYLIILETKSDGAYVGTYVFIKASN